MTRCYQELKKLKTFQERYDYLRLCGTVGDTTFGFDRHLNQTLYKTRLWQVARRTVILRDNSCDLGVEGYDIYDKIIVHHMNPITIEDVARGNPEVYDPDFLICTTMETHNAIHYGSMSLITDLGTERVQGDTELW